MMIFKPQGRNMLIKAVHFSLVVNSLVMYLVTGI